VASARRIRRLLTEWNRKGTTILLTTHYIEEAERLCRRVAFLVEGRIVETDLVENLLGRVEGRTRTAFLLDGPLPEMGEMRETLAREFPDLRVERIGGGRVEISSEGPLRIGPLVRFFEERGLEVLEARRIRTSLEDVFLRLTGIEAEGMKGRNPGAGGER